MESTNVYDSCYERYYDLNVDAFRLSEPRDPYAAAARIIPEIAASEVRDCQTRLREPVHPDFKPSLLPATVANALVHALGAWKLAERCLDVDGVKLQADADTEVRPLVHWLTFGPGGRESWSGEFCLAAFLQAYRDHLGSHQDGSCSSSGQGILGLLESSATFRDYQAAGRDLFETDLIVYWVEGEPLQRADRRERPLAQTVARTLCTVFFAPDAPLNLRHLDLLARIYSASRSAAEEVRLEEVLRNFLNRILLGPEKRSLGRKSASLPCSLVRGVEDQDPTVPQPFLEALERVRRADSLSKSHSLFQASRTVDHRDDQVGLLQLQYSTTLDALAG